MKQNSKVLKVRVISDTFSIALIRDDHRDWARFYVAFSHPRIPGQWQFVRGFSSLSQAMAALKAL